MRTSGQAVRALRRSFNVVAHPHMRDRVELVRLANEQASLRRVATLVAEGAAPTSVLAVVAEEVARVVNVWGVSIVRYEADSTATELANYTEQGQLLAIGTRWFLDGVSVVGDVRESGRPAAHRRLVRWRA